MRKIKLNKDTEKTVDVIDGIRKIKLNKDTEKTVDVNKYVLELHKEEAKRINKLKDYNNNNNDKVKRE